MAVITVGIRRRSIALSLQGKKTNMSCRNACGVWIVLLSAASLTLGACSSSFGGGSSPPKTVVIPANQKIVCIDGTEPPCK